MTDDGYSPARTEHHERLSPLIGVFRSAGRSWRGPGAEAMTSSGTMINRWILGGLFMEQDYKGTFNGAAFVGRGYWGFNEASGLYESVWMDSTGGQIARDAGAFRDGVWEMRGESFMADGTAREQRSVVRVVDQDRHTMELYFTPRGGEEFLALQVEYRRVG